MKFRKRPVIVDAVQTIEKTIIGTLEGEMTAEPGDWIITGVKGEKYPCKPGIFAMTYEALIESGVTAPSPAPLPKDVAEAMGRMYEMLGDAFLYRWKIRFVQSTSNSDREKDEAAVAVIKAALRPKVVSREWVTWFVKTIFDMRDRGVSFSIEEAAETMLQSQGIEVEP